MKTISYYLLSAILIMSTAEALGRYTVAKQHETPLIMIDDFGEG